MLFLIGVTFFLSSLVVGVAARLFLYPIVTVAESLEWDRLSDREVEAFVELVRGVVEKNPTATVVRDGWEPHQIRRPGEGTLS